MNHPNELSYSKSHEWVKMDGDTAIIGISDFAQDALGDVVFVNLPAEATTSPPPKPLATLSPSRPYPT